MGNRETSGARGGPAASKLSVWWKRACITIVLIGLGTALWGGFLQYQFQASMPRKSDPITGRIHPLNVHGIVVYLTKDQREEIDRLDYVSIAFGAAFVVMGAIYQKFNPSPSYRPIDGRDLKL